MQISSSIRSLPRATIIWLLVAVNAALLWTWLPPQVSTWLGERFSVFTTIFLGIFIEAVPFLLLGTLASGLVEAFISQETIARLAPRRSGIGGRLGSALTGGLLGLFFPVCECGVVPLARRLIRKGLPISTGIAFLLAAPVLNPIVILSTAAAFGFGPMLALRVGVSLLIAVVAGLVFSVEKDPSNILRPAASTTTPTVVHISLESLAVLPPPASPTAKGGARSPGPSFGPNLTDRLRQVAQVTLDEFFEMGRYLVAGAALAAGLQAFIPQASLLSVGQGPLASVLVMAGLAALLSICSTVDAFVALGFIGAFSPGSILTFLTFGPMVDIKSILLYLQVFRPRPVLYLVLLPLAFSVLAGLLVNYYLVLP